MRCPNCGSENFARVPGKGGKPRSIEGVTFRQHQCRDCRHFFSSAQITVEERLAGELLVQREISDAT